MEEIENLRKELGRLDDMIDMVESKIHNLIGLLELVYQGTKTVNGVEDSYEMCSIVDHQIICTYFCQIILTQFCHIPLVHAY